MRKHVFILLAGVAAWAAGTVPALAATEQVFEKSRETCRHAAAEVEKRLNIPAHLLGAIALAETGRWDDSRQESFAWPWTVMAEGRGRYFATKAEAVAAVKKLIDRGISNIDVGCMQVNLYYHGGAFTGIEQALDPDANAAYAGGYLADLFGATGSWTQAAAYYHSTTPELSADYKRKVVGLWRQTRRLAATGARDRIDDDDTGDDVAATTPPEDASVKNRNLTLSIDYARTARLNARFKTTSQRERALDFTERRAQQLAYWREAQAASLPNRHIAIMRRAQAAAERTRAIAERQVDRAEAFAERRRDQLRRWRLNADPNGTGG